jgi:hypothetical protein
LENKLLPCSSNAILTARDSILRRKSTPDIRLSLSMKLKRMRFLSYYIKVYWNLKIIIFMFRHCLNNLSTVVLLD